MPRNVEIKARIESMISIFPKAAALADGDPVEILQEDTFFACANGRLKLRVLSADHGELIFYRRPDQKGSKESSYIVSTTSTPFALHECLSLALGQVGHIRKKRTLFRVGRTRIHLDRVEGLGDFLELEVVLADNEDVKIGEAIVADLMEKLGVRPDQLIAGAYIDLLPPEGEVLDSTTR